MSDPDFAAETEIEAEAAEVFAFLADLENHWRLTGRSVRVLELEGPPGARTGGSVRLRGPLGIGRVARTAVLESEAPEWMAGSALLAPATEAAVRWTIEPLASGTRVRIEATIVRAGRLDRILLALGGRRLMRRVFREAVGGLRQLSGSRVAAPVRVS